MTQKELSYVEDAIGHETNIVKICNDIMSNLEDSTLKEFMESEINTHSCMKEKLMSLLEEKANE